MADKAIGLNVRGVSMNPIFQGIFWAICNYDANDCPDIRTFDLLYFKVLCDIDGMILDHNAQLNSKSGKSFNHKVQWRQIPKKIVKGHSYQYYPRGRVEIKNRKAIIFLNPVINELSVIDRIKREFCLDNEGIHTIEVKSDGSSHYNCHFDDPSII